MTFNRQKLRFSVRVLLTIITLCAIFLWWYINIPIGVISQEQAARIIPGMTKAEIGSLLGKPDSRLDSQEWGEAWSYLIRRKSTDSNQTRLVIFFNRVDEQAALVFVRNDELQK